MKAFSRNFLAFITCTFLIALSVGFAIGTKPDLVPACHWHQTVDTLKASVTWFGNSQFTSAGVFLFAFKKPGEREASFIISFLKTVVFSLFIAGIVTTFYKITPFVSFVASFVGIVLIGVASYLMPSAPEGVTANGILKEIWIAQIMEYFIPDGSYLSRSQDMSGEVSNNVIHLTEAGADPDVLMDNTVYPVPFDDRTDNPLGIPLHYFDTEGTVVRNSEQKQLAYAKMESVIRGHRRSLFRQTLKWATYNWFPASTAALTPVNATSGKNFGVAAAVASPSLPTRLAFSLADLAVQKKLLDDMQAPEEGRVAILSTQHASDIFAQDQLLFKQFSNLETGKVLKLSGFDIYVGQVNPTFNVNTGVKNAFGAAALDTDAPASLFYLEEEVMRCIGGVDMFYRLNDPEAKGDIINFQQFFHGQSIRNKYATVVYSAAS